MLYNGYSESGREVGFAYIIKKKKDGRNSKQTHKQEIKQKVKLAKENGL